MKDILKGIIIGIGKVIPGVSGSVLAISLGVYERAINDLNKLFHKISINIFLVKLLTGILISIVFGSKIIFYFLNNYYNYTIFVFLGFIIGGISDVTVNIRKKYWFFTLISFMLIFLLAFFDVSSSFANNTNTFYYFLSGMIESVSAIVPGISGTAMLMLIGSYEKIVYLFANILNIRVIIDNITIVIPFMFGTVFGIFVSIKLINFLFKRFYHQTYNIVLGFLLGSVFMMINSCDFDLKSIMISSVYFIISFLFIKKVNHFL